MTYYIILEAYGGCGQEVILVTNDKDKAQEEFDKIRMDVLNTNNNYYNTEEELDFEESLEEYMDYTDREEYYLLEWSDKNVHNS